MTCALTGDWHEYNIKTKKVSSLAPLGERGDRKAGGEGVSTNMKALGQVGMSRCSADLRL